MVSWVVFPRVPVGSSICDKQYCESQYVDGHRSPDLGLHGIPGGAEGRPDVQVLLDSWEMCRKTRMLGRMLHDLREHPFAFVHDLLLCLRVNFHSEIHREILIFSV